MFVEELLDRLAGDPALEASVRANTPDNARLTFDHILSDGCRRWSRSTSSSTSG
ncbi:MAG: hypothetical protein ACRDJ4_02555 [Actinomycetota bacterium]